MTAVLTSPADVVNAALGRIGYRLRIGSIWEGSDGSKRALDIYGQTRDALLRQLNPEFARNQVALGAPLKTAPYNGYTPANPWTNAFPPMPFLYTYAYPPDALEVQQIVPQPAIMPDLSPRPVDFLVQNDNSVVPPRKIIATDLNPATASYTRQVTDPSTWEPSFTETLIEGLARRLAPSLATLDVEKLEASAEQATAAADMVGQGR